MRLGAVFLVIMGTVPAVPAVAQAHESAPGPAPAAHLRAEASPLTEGATPAPGVLTSFPFGMADGMLLALGSLVLGALARGAPHVLHHRPSPGSPFRRRGHRRRVEPVPGGAGPEAVTTPLLSTP